MFSYDKAIVEASKVFQIAGNLVDKWGFTKQERAENDTKRAEGYHQFMSLTDAVAQQIRSKTRAKIVKLVVYPYVCGWIATFPIMVVSVFFPPVKILLELTIAWLKMFTPIVAAFGGSYIGYYGIQSIMGTIRNGKKDNGKK